MPWKWHETVWGSVWLKVPWKRHESGMKATWIWDEYDMVGSNNFGVFFRKVPWKRHESAMKNCRNPLYHIHVIFISDSCRFHGTIMALSCHFLVIFISTPNMAPPTVSWHFHGRFMLLSWYFPLWPCLDLPWRWHESAVKVTWGKCHESAMNLPDLHETYTADSSRMHVIFFQTY